MHFSTIKTWGKRVHIYAYLRVLRSQKHKKPESALQSRKCLSRGQGIWSQGSWLLDCTFPNCMYLVMVNIHLFLDSENIGFHFQTHLYTCVLCHAANSSPAHSPPEIRGEEPMASPKSPRWLRGEESVTEDRWIYETSKELCLFK